MSAAPRPELPLEVYTYILSFFHPRHEQGLQTLLSVLATSHYLRAAASASTLWKPYYDARYSHSVPENEELRKARYEDDYRLRYFARRELDRAALRLLDEIRTQVPGRSARACVLVRQYSFDVWDALQLEQQLPIPRYFRRNGHLAGAKDPAPHALPRRYWAGVVQGVIARYWAVKMWQRVASGDWTVSFEEMLAGFSAFFDWSPYEISESLDDVAEECRGELEEEGIELSQSEPDFDLMKACQGVIKYMRGEGWLLSQHNPELDEHLLNSFPHTLFTAAPGSFPLSVLSKTWLFTGICRRLGIDAYASRLPPDDTVCCVRSPRESEAFVVNFRNNEQPISRGSEVPFFKRMVDAGYPDLASCGFIPLPAIAFFVEAVHNVSHDLRRYHDNEIGPWDNDDEERELLAAHAMQCAVAVTHDGQSVSPMIFPDRMAEILPLDGEPIFLDALFGGVPPPQQRAEFVEEVLATIRRTEDVEARVKRRSQYPGEVIRHFVGQVVHNSRLSEDGCVIDWQFSPHSSDLLEDSPEFNEGPIRYRVLSMDFVEFVREPTGYETGGLTEEAARSLYISWKHFGRYFEDVSTEDMIPDEDGRLLPTRLVLTAEMQTLYPEDVQVPCPPPTTTGKVGGGQ
ncbi:hypothetical protein BD413DRAFT_704864 [Trametes elegans]|nr:hypothetical protein BD413DRAFT_704864 [Trametes elegans]